MLTTPTPAQQITLWAEQLRDLSALGLYFSKNPYDLENYEKIQNLVLEMMALATGAPLAELEPLRASVFRRPTPLSVGDAAMIDEEGRILLIRRADNGLWAMPGGALAVGETPAEGVARETLEETGVRCQPLALVGVHDSRLCGSLTAHHLYHFCFLCRPVDGVEPVAPPSHGFETLGSAWFAEDELPADLDPGHAERIPEAFRVWRGDRRPYFDGQPLPEATLVFLLRGNSPQVLLGHKRTGLGAGKFGGIGGKVESGETAVAAAVRELEEEVGVRVVERDLDYVARLDFVFPHRPTWGHRVHAYLATRWRGEPVESAEMAPVWFDPAAIPYGQMWQDGAHWLPRVLAGERLRGRFVFAADNETVQEVEFGSFSPSPDPSPKGGESG